MCKRITAILLALLLCVGGIPFTVMADTGATSDDLTLLFEDTFDSYGRETSISATSMVDFFHSEANVYGNGYIRVTQGESDNWYLESNVFTEVFNETPIVGSYAFSLDVLGAGGAVSSGVFVRGLDTAPCFYEADGHPGSSTGQSGLFLYPRESQLGVNIKTYDPNWTEWDAFVQNNTIMFDLPADVTYPYNIKVTDTAKEITVYVNDTLMCRIDISNPGKTYEKHCSNDECYGTATLYGADGAVLGNYTDTLLGSFGSIFGWATRATDISVDNVRVWIGKAQQTILAIEKLPASVNTSNLDKAKELVAAARDLYDGLSADEKDLISNYENLLKLEAGIREVEETLNVKWSDPAYTEMETTSEDTAEGTLKYTLSEDGTTVTISYAVNGETLSYTVPNHDNYLFGGYAATDDLGRSLYDSYEVGSYGSGQERYVGLFYFLCQGEHGRSDNLVDLQKVLDKYGPEVAGQKNDTIYPEGANFWWGEPLYGYYYSTDAWVMRKHAELLTLAGVDFLYFDVTNGYTYIHNATKLMECLHDLNEQGFDAPQVVFYTSSNSEDVIRQLYDKIYSENIYPDTWFRVNGKPVIIGMSDFDMDGFFTVKRRMWPTDANVVENGWPWMDFNWPQRAIKNRAGDGSAISVSVAQHSMFPFSDSSLYGNCMNRGRSYNNPDNVRYRGNISQDYRQTLENSYNAWLSDETLTMHGINLQKQFDNAVESDATYVLVTGWNEWSVGNLISETSESRPYVFIDCASMEFSRDTEMMRGGYFDNYYIQLTYNIQRLKGTAPIIVQDSRKPINVTGEFDQWDAVEVIYKDAANDIDDRNSLGGGNVTYTNTSGRNDIVSAKVTSDTKNLYIYVQTAHNITMFDPDSSWMQIYLNTDRESTGWYGYDFILNHKAKDEFTTTVAKYNGMEGAYGFETCGEVSYRVKGTEMMISVPLSLLGIEGYKEINVEFKIADSDTVYDEMEDFYCDGDVAPLGRMNYIYQNYIPGVSQITYPESETTVPDTEATADTIAEAESVTAKTESPTKKGCKSSLAFAPAALLLPALAMCLHRWRREN